MASKLHPGERSPGKIPPASGCPAAGSLNVNAHILNTEIL